MPIEKDRHGRPEIHYTRIYRAFRRWESDGCLDAVLEASVFRLHGDDRLDTRIIHGDGTTTAAKKGGDNLGFSGSIQRYVDQYNLINARSCGRPPPIPSSQG
ncbi:hypothetical protein OKW33_006497 [Paraburkholderia atlantica]|uniref:Uncharacterized protein n=1 Tax=Paraburkholderia atlantica TaxID=2654982 RepID=A0A7W8V3M9_PARAM|nr:hypothetical protein [Paraburkholderia atlantica]MBB5421600.1 hypothetical protein [Paraburkholderia atlantica]MBB5429619.1 hypothetical protein [Paraburkholderia atlantica]